MQIFLTLILVKLLCISCTAYKPVVLISGLGTTSDFLNPLKKTIEEAHPGTDVRSLAVYTGLLTATTPLWTQIRDYRPLLRKIMNANPDGVHIIGYSQGALIARGLIETTPNHNVDTFISLAGPQMGVFGFPEQNNFLGLNSLAIYSKKTVYILAYGILRSSVAPAGYWKDPYQHSSYLSRNKFLPVINNEVSHKNSSAYKQNFLKLKKYVMIGSKGDRVVKPWQSSVGGFYDRNEKIVPLEQQKIYLDDLYGLKTMDEDGRLARHVVENVQHASTPFNKNVQEIMLQYLT